MVRRAQTELDSFVRLLKSEGVRVRRPEPIDQRRCVHTRVWSSRGFCLACPRDIYLVVGDEIIETPTCWRARHFEGDAYRKLVFRWWRALDRCAAATAAGRVV
jgi:glycine amidinotransferase